MFKKKKRYTRDLGVQGGIFVFIICGVIGLFTNPDVDCLICIIEVQLVAFRALQLKDLGASKWTSEVKDVLLLCKMKGERSKCLTLAARFSFNFLLSCYRSLHLLSLLIPLLYLVLFYIVNCQQIP